MYIKKTSVALLLLLTACATPSSHRGKGWVKNMTPLDVKACYPRLDRDFGDDTKLEGMWIAVEDTFPRIQECANDYFYREGSYNGRLEVTLNVEADHTVSLTHSLEGADAKFEACVSRALKMIDLPKSSEPSGQQYTSGFDISYEGSNSLRIGGGPMGALVGPIRTSALDMCDCLADYKNTEPPNVKFAFEMKKGDPYAKNIRLASDVDDPELVNCLKEHLAQVHIQEYDQDLKASYRFKFENSRAMGVDRMLRDAGELANRGERLEALKLYRQVLDREPENVTALLGVTHIYYENEQYEEALKWVRKAHEADPDNHIARYDLARCHLALGEVKKARKWVEAALDVDDESFHAHHVLSSIEHSEGNYRKARKAARRSRDINPKYARAYIAEAQAEHKLGNHDAALELLAEATRRDLEDPSAYFAIAMVQYELKAWEDGLRALDRAIEKGFDDARVHYNRGIFLKRLGRRAKARKAFCTAAEMEPEFRDAVEACKR